jgi:hypothetical protein
VEDWATLVERVARERVSRVEVESAAMLASAHEEAKCLVWKITLLEGELVEVRRAWEVAKENSHGLSNMADDAERRWEVSEWEHQEHFEELTLLQTWGSELCLAIVNPPQVRNHLSEGMWVTTLRHTEMAGELVVIQAVLSLLVLLKHQFHAPTCRVNV